MEAAIRNTGSCCCLLSSPSPSPSPSPWRRRMGMGMAMEMRRRRGLRASPCRAVAAETEDTGTSSRIRIRTRIDRSGRFSSPRSARELALLLSYASCLQGTDPLHLFHTRVNATRVPGFVFDKQLLFSYDHMTFATQPLQVATPQEEQQFIHHFETHSALEADVLSAPLKLVYSNSVLRFTREILEAVTSGWNQRIHVINKVIPQQWKNEAASRIIELCILHIAMAEITSKGTKHQIVINEAVDLAKRFCDGRAPRIINGCLGTFVKQRSEEIVESEAIQLT